MGVDGKLEVDIDLKSPADDFFKLLVNETHNFITASPDIVHDVEIHEGDGYTHGSVKLWTYCVEPGGKKEVLKEKVSVDEQNKTLEMVAVGGDILEKYKVYKIVYKVFTKEDGTGVVKLQLVYEKFKEADPEPNDYLKVVTKLLKDTDSHIFKKLQGSSN